MFHLGSQTEIYLNDLIEVNNVEYDISFDQKRIVEILSGMERLL